MQGLYEPPVKRCLAILVVSGLLGAYLKMGGASSFSSAVFAVFVLAFLCVLMVLDRDNTAARNPSSGRIRADFDWGMHYFRGFAIFCIVLMHVQSSLGYTFVTRAFFKASTVYFLFISGYLCQYLHDRKPTSAGAYYKKKALNVLLPYLIWTVLTCLIVSMTGMKRPGLLERYSASVSGFFWLVVNGSAQRPYWYIPFVTVLFALSPFLRKSSSTTLLCLTSVSGMLALVFPSRCGAAIDWSCGLEMLNHYFYFTVYYLLGFVYARYKTVMDGQLKILALPALLLGVVLGVNYLSPGVFHLKVLQGDQMFAFQKCFFTIPVLLLAVALRRRHIVLLDLLAKYSFTLFFLHYLFIGDVKLLQAVLKTHGLSCWATDYLLMLLFVLALMGLSVLLKKATGRFSRCVIGS